MKTWYVLYRRSGFWYNLTTTKADSAQEAISKNYQILVKHSNDSGYYRATSKSRLPWDKNK
jgi:hypothetical protein